MTTGRRPLRPGQAARFAELLGRPDDDRRARPAEQLRRRRAEVVTASPLTVDVARSGVAVPASAPPHVILLPGDEVNVIEDGPDLLALGIVGAGGATGSRVLFIGTNNLGGGPWGPGLTEITLNVINIDPLGLYNAGTFRWTAPYAGWYRASSFAAIAGGANVAYWAGAVTNGGAGWASMGHSSPSPVNATLTIHDVGPPLFLAAGVTFSLGLLASSGTHNFGSGFGMNNHLVVEYLGP
jgi:hypothetical protein